MPDQSDSLADARAMRPGSVKEFFRDLPAKLDAEAAEEIEAVYQFDLSGPEGGQYHLTIKDGACSVQEGVHPDPQVTLSLSGADCLGILEGKLDGPSVALSGRLRVAGDLVLAIRLKSLFPSIR
jgi:putative sterol carrier protein